MVEIVFPNYPITGSYDIGLVITTFNRPEYVEECFKSLLKSALENVIIVVVDDASDSRETLSLIKGFSMPDVPVIKIFKEERNGFAIHRSLQVGWDFISKKYPCQYLCNLDSDAIVNKNWMRCLSNTYKKQNLKRGPLIVTGFNAHSHPVLEEYRNYCIKKSIGGLNMFFDLTVYQQIIRPHLEFNWDWLVMDAMQHFGYPILCTTPSVIQHIGKTGQWSNPNRGYDIALDFKSDSVRWRFKLWADLYLYPHLKSLGGLLLRGDSDE